MKLYNDIAGRAQPDSHDNWRSLYSAAEPHLILSEMFHAANEKADFLLSFAQDNGTCGYAWVLIPQSETSIIAALGSYGSTQTGAYRINATCCDFQSIQHREAVANAMAASLRKNGVRAWVDSRMD